VRKLRSLCARRCCMRCMSSACWPAQPAGCLRHSCTGLCHIQPCCFFDTLASQRPLSRVCSMHASLLEPLQPFSFASSCFSYASFIPAYATLTQYIYGTFKQQPSLTRPWCMLLYGIVWYGVLCTQGPAARVWHVCQPAGASAAVPGGRDSSVCAAPRA
jgi:hypothetical protein